MCCSSCEISFPTLNKHKELIRKQKKAAKEVRSAPDGIDPRVDEDNDQEEFGDLSIGEDDADMIAKTARDVFRVLFSGHLYTWSRDSGRYHAILCAA